MTVLFCDLRGYTNFADVVEPEELMGVLAEFHDAIGRLVEQYEATVGSLQGDGVELFFNDLIEIPDAPLRAVRLSCSLRDDVEAARTLAQARLRARLRGRDRPGVRDTRRDRVRGRSDYAATVTNLARGSDEATGGQILIGQRLYAEVEEHVEAEPAGEFTLKGFPRPVPAFNVLSITA